ncbi:hypothetical protein BJ165DRAFT_1406968 [Panaeolus papilionaceus]|nr:hypothetical protein BJ165DRAFT_1406968 [Panaeolus papilionaceus]
MPRRPDQQPRQNEAGGDTRDIPRDEDGIESSIPEKRKISPTSPSGTPAPSTTEDPTTSLFAEDKSLKASKAKAEGGVIKPRLRPANLRALEAEKEREVVKGWRRWCEVWEGMLREVDGVEDVGDEGRGGGTTEKSNERIRIAAYSPETEPDGNRMAHRIRLPHPTKYQIGGRYCTLYCFIPMKQGQYDVAEEICAISSFQFQTHTPTTRLAKRNQYRIDRSCSILAEQPDVVVEQVRKLITQHQFNNEPLRILLASPRAEMKLSYTSMKNPEILKWNGLNRRISTKENPVIVAIYGKIYVAAKSYVPFSTSSTPTTPT